MAAPGRFSCILALGVNVNFNIDVNKVGDSIANAISGQGNADRAGFVKNINNQCFYSEGQKYNCMVFNLGQEYQWTDQQGIVLYGSAVYQGITYGIWAFESGTFDNQGDGGYINWAFFGNFDRNGNHVVFHPMS
ncbi:g11823 [Coccomyxa elongata]